MFPKVAFLGLAGENLALYINGLTHGADAGVAQG